MDWERYKQICDRPNVFSRWMLEQTAELLDPDARRALTAVLERGALAKPADHKGGTGTDMFELTLDVHEVDSIHTQVHNAAASGQTTSATGERGLGGFVEAWADYGASLRCRAPILPGPRT